MEVLPLGPSRNLLIRTPRRAVHRGSPGLQETRKLKGPVHRRPASATRIRALGCQRGCQVLPLGRPPPGLTRRAQRITCEDF